MVSDELSRLVVVGNFDYIWYKIIDHGVIGRYETRVFPDGHPREGEIYILDSTLKCNRATKEYLKGRLEVKAFTWSFI